MIKRKTAKLRNNGILLKKKDGETVDSVHKQEK
ncbi:hypothetical protein PI23P_11042 [Polaribacter irgensii 23-P]|uniref:Uncharacterized protein n=1 Tax=Polaribacter irgensii 23-P TaxID=313594 RepID=A4C161_9FLAO|nr:hypothetical protein PI23P_11042 [Polaribacter irgensii 23-P]